MPVLYGRGTGGILPKHTLRRRARKSPIYSRCVVDTFRQEKPKRRTGRKKPLCQRCKPSKSPTPFLFLLLRSQRRELNCPTRERKETVHGGREGEGDISQWPPREKREEGEGGIFPSMGRSWRGGGTGTWEMHAETEEEEKRRDPASLITILCIQDKRNGRSFTRRKEETRILCRQLGVCHHGHLFCFEKV